MVTCPLAPGMPHLISGSCSSPRTFALDFLWTSPRDDALVLSLAFGSAKTWPGDSHPGSYVPCPAHTLRITRGRKPSRASGLLDMRRQTLTVSPNRSVHWLLALASPLPQYFV